MTRPVSLTTGALYGHIREPSNGETVLVLSDQSLDGISRPLEACALLATPFCSRNSEDQIESSIENVNCLRCDTRAETG